MTQYVNSDMTLGEVASAVLQQYHEPVTGSSAMDIDLVYDTINSVYFELFNEPVDLSYYREKSFTFQSVADTTINQTGGVSPGDTSFVVADSTSFPNATRTILIGNTDFATYTGNTVLTNTLTGVSGIDVAQDEGVSVRLGYPISSISGIDEEQITAVWVNGLRFDYEPPESFLSVDKPHYLKFSILESNLYLPLGTATGIATLTYFQEVVVMDDVGDKPSLIPGKFRYGLLVHGAVTRLGVRDDLRTGYDWHEAQYEKNKKRFFALGNNRVKTKGANMRPSVYG